ncbi:EndoU domain-containing protein [Carnobacterium maltaromaticum]|uniref:EndoU domain-containing protein n=1 Tax=Carnobacterium maltaromaticum TaxID=2751 RepID=UPI0039BE4B8B
MSIDFFIGEVGIQTQSIKSYCNEVISGMDQVRTALSQFVIEPSLKGGAYDSSKSYFNSAYIPATKGFTLVCEAMIKANDQFSNDYKSTVDSNSLQEDVLVSYISRLNSLSTALEELPAGNIFLSSVIENLQNVRQKTDEKLDKLREYNYTSVHIFDELESQLQNLEAGVMMLVEGKAWNQSTGTFSTMGLNLDWATDINQSWDARDKKQKALKAEAEKIAFEKELKSRTYKYVEVAGKRMWLWVKDPSKVTKDDLEFNERYKLFFDGKSEKDGIKNVLVNNQNEDWLTTIGIELKTGINASTGKPLTTNEKIQRWGILAGIVTTSLTAMFYNVKGTNKLKPPAKSSVKNLSKEEQLRQNVLKNIEESKKARESSNFKEFTDKSNDIIKNATGSNGFKFGSNSKNHLKNVETVNTKKGVVGGHNMNDFNNALKNQGFNPEDLIVSKKPHPTIEGIYEVEYKIPRKDMAGNVADPVSYKNIEKPKTVYDPTKISDNQMYEWGQTAMNNGKIQPDGRTIIGTSPNGVKFIGYLNDVGEVTNFFPVLN